MPQTPEAEHTVLVDTLLFLLTKFLVAIAVLGVIGCCLVIPFTAVSILRVAFQKDTENELAERTQRLTNKPVS